MGVGLTGVENVRYLSPVHHPVEECNAYKALQKIGSLALMALIEGGGFGDKYAQGGGWGACVNARVRVTPLTSLLDCWRSPDPMHNVHTAQENIRSKD